MYYINIKNEKKVAQNPCIMLFVFAESLLKSLGLMVQSQTKSGSKLVLDKVP